MFNPITAEALARAIHQDLLRDAEIARRAHRARRTEIGSRVVSGEFWVPQHLNPTRP